MELLFYCPVTCRVFWSPRWQVEGCMDVSVDEDGRKRLQGRVRTACPLCGGEHVYDPDELACPLSKHGEDVGGNCNTKGGE
jgi:hypothetical protein